MQDATVKQELELLQLRIDASPIEKRAELQAQLDTLLRNLDQNARPVSAEQEQKDAKVEALFDNMPV